MACKITVIDSAEDVRVSFADLPVTLKLAAFPGNPGAGVKAGTLATGMQIESVDYFVPNPAPGSHTDIALAADGISFQLLAKDMKVGSGVLTVRLNRRPQSPYMVVEDCAPATTILLIQDPISREDSVTLEVTP
jgi:hypothetical protein